MKALESDNMWYFRTDDGADSSSYDSVMLPVDQITGILPGNTTSKMRIYFEQATDKPTVDGTQQNGYITIGITAGYQKEILEFLAQAAASSTHHIGYQTIADDVTGEYAFRYIKSVDAVYNR
jgi:hypothetical protein